MTQRVRELLERYIELIDNNDYKSLYFFIATNYASEVTETLFSVGIDPAIFLTSLPKYYAEGLDVEKYHIPSCIRKISQNAFNDCVSLKELTFAEGCEEIGPFGFSGCSNLTEVILPKSCSSIAWCAFSDCTSLKHIEIPGVFAISNNAFDNCCNLEYIKIPDTVQTIPNRCFYECKKLKHIELSSTLTSIFSEAFKVSGLESITLPRTINKIGMHAFDSCSNLTEIYYEGTMNDWQKVHINDASFSNIPCTIVKCVDGDIPLEERFL